MSRWNRSRKLVVGVAAVVTAGWFGLGPIGPAAGGPHGVQVPRASTTVLVQTQLRIILSPISAPAGTPVSIQVDLTASTYPVLPLSGTIAISVAGVSECEVDVGSGDPCVVASPPIGRDEVDASYGGDDTYAPTSSANYLFVTNPSPSVTCAKVSGNYFTSPVVFSHCSPSMGKLDKKATSTSPLEYSLTLVWSGTGQTTVASQRMDVVGQGSCKAKSVELDVLSVVTGGTSTYTSLYDPVSFRLCRSPKFNLSLVPGTEAAI